MRSPGLGKGPKTGSPGCGSAETPEGRVCAETCGQDASPGERHGCQRLSSGIKVGPGVEDLALASVTEAPLAHHQVRASDSLPCS